MAAFGEHLRPPGGDGFVVVPSLEDSDPLYLQLVAKFGSLDDEALKRAVHRLRPGILDPAVEYSTFARLKHVDFSNQPEELLLGKLPENQVPLGDDRVYKLTDLTQIGLFVTWTDWSSQSAPERPVPEDAFANCPIVTGDARSVADLALYWNLRSERPYVDPFPLWIPSEVLDSPLGERVVKQALEQMDQKMRGELPWGVTLQVISASVHSKGLVDRLRSRYADAGIGVERLADLFMGETHYYLTKDQFPVNFEEGSARLLRLRPEAFESFVPTLDRAVHEIDIDGVWLPQSKTLMEREIHGQMGGRATKRGTLAYTEYARVRTSSSELRSLILPDGWTLLSSMLKDCGYDCSPSSKSGTALGQLSLLGGIPNLSVAASSKIHRWLRTLSERAAEERGFLAERKTAGYNQFMDEWGRDVAPDLLRWLIERRVLFRGADIPCPRCRLKRWYEVDRLGHTWRCDGCQEDQPLPLNLSQTGWKYRINELYARGYDQGTVTPLLVLNHMHRLWGSPNRAGFGCYPGVELKARDGARVPVDRIEIDLMALLRGRLILVECKESGEQLAEPDEAHVFSRQLARLAGLAEHLDASRLVVATSTTFPEDREPLLVGLPEDWARKVEWWDADLLLDFDPYERGEDEGWPEKYLSMVSRVARPSP